MGIGLSNAELGRMYIRVEADIKDVSAQLTQLRSKMSETAIAGKGFGNSMQGVFNQMSSGGGLGMLSRGGIIAGIATGLVMLTKSALSSAASLEENTAAFEVMLGSSSKAKKMISDITDFAAKTPYQMEGLISGAKMMMSFGVEQEKVMQNLQMIGDVSAGSAEKMQSMTLAFSQMTASGRLMGQDLLQMINAGFNPLQEMSRKTGKSMGTLKDEMEKGAISADMVRESFKSATGSGGRFFQMMEKQSKTLSGIWSTMEDNFVIMLTKMGTDMAPAFKNAIGAISQFLNSGSLLTKMLGLIGKSVSIVVNSFAVLAYGISTVTGKVRKELAEMEEDSIVSGIRMMSNNDKRIVDYATAVKYMSKAASVAYGDSLKAVHEEIAGHDKGLDESIAGLKQSWKDLWGIEKEATKVIENDTAATKSNANEKKKLTEEQKKLLKLLEDLKEKNLETIFSDMASSIQYSFPKASSSFSNLAKSITDFMKLQDQFKSLGSEMPIGQKIAGVAGMLKNTFVTVFSAIGDLTDNYFKNLSSQFENSVAEQNMMLELWHNQQLAANGLQEQTNLQKSNKELGQLQSKLNATRDSKKRTELQEQINLKQSEKKKYEIQEDYDKRKALLEAYQEMRKRQINQRQAVAQKSLAIFTAVVNTAAAISSAIGTSGNIYAGIALAIVAGAMGAAQIGIIAGTPIPAMAKGGYAENPAIGMFGEAGPEAVMPLNDEVFAKFSAGIVNQMAKMSEATEPSREGTISSPSSADRVPLVANIYLGAKKIYSELTEATRNGQLLLSKRAIV
jgi:tape measure domain-containing protein